MNVEFYILLRIAFLKHPVVKDIRYLRNLAWGMHNRHILLDTQRSLWGRLGDHWLHDQWICSKVLRLQWLIDNTSLGLAWITSAVNDFPRDSIQISYCIQDLLDRRSLNLLGCCSGVRWRVHQTSKMAISLARLFLICPWIIQSWSLSIGSWIT